MNVASLELCKELYNLSGWGETEVSWYKYYDDASITWTGVMDGTNGVFICPAYDMGYLIRKLPETSLLIKVSGAYAAYMEWTKKSAEDGNEFHSHTPTAETPEDAVAKLAIQLYEYGLLVREE